MDLRPYIDEIQHELAVAAESGGDDARALAARLVAPLDAAIRLALQDVLAAAAEEITCELAPGSVDLRLRGRNPEFVVTPPPAEDLSENDPFEMPSDAVRAAAAVAPGAAGEADEDAMSRINLRLPDHLKARIERAAGSEALSINAWLVRAATAALQRGDVGPRREPGTPRGDQRYTGWVR